ncbi:uncharacterized protein DS421_1g28230 [Arachis hypogaea]|nr:uncharacterized protein DS421_1g09290 [Arachis hypogaea]QHO51124.1 uncharacterized protein DS421_1g28230 [Arachis hypogaea]
MSRRSRGNQCSSNGSISEEGTSSSKRGEENTLSGRYFCGQGVTMDCKYFVWVDEIDGGWEGLARALVRKNQDSSCSSHEVNLTGQRREIQENSVKILLKIGKLHGEIRTISFLVSMMMNLEAGWFR